MDIVVVEGSVNMDIEYYSGRGNLALTILMPAPCKFNCKFCTKPTIKSDYSIDNILKTLDGTCMRFRDELNLLNEVVISGGEPFNDFKSLKKLFTKLLYYSKAIYINTSGYSLDQVMELTEIYNSVNPNITSGIDLALNISRHGSSIKNDYEVFGCSTGIEPDKSIHKILQDTPFRVRINCVETECNYLDIINRWHKEFSKYEDKFSISLRNDYSVTTSSDLRLINNNFVKLINSLNSKYDIELLSITKCNVCFTINMLINGLYVGFHKGLPTTLVDGIYGPDTKGINDIILKGDGKYYPDWVGSDTISEIDVIRLITKTYNIN